MAEAPKMGVVVADIGKTWRLQRNYLWEVRLPGADGLNVAKYCQNIQFGDYSMTSPSTIRYGAFQAHYAGYMQVPPVVMTFLKPIPDIVTPYFHDWRAKIVDDAGFFHPKSEYADTIHLYMFDNDGTETDHVRFHQAFPNEFPGYDLSYNSSEIVKLKVTFQIDRLYFE